MPIYIFQNRDSDIHAYSVDKTGANIPMQDDVRYCWFLRGAGDAIDHLPLEAIASGAIEDVEADLLG